MRIVTTVLLVVLSETAAWYSPGFLKGNNFLTFRSDSILHNHHDAVDDQQPRVKLFAKEQSASADDDYDNNNDDEGCHYSVTVSFEGRSCDVKVAPGETILNAMERSGAADRLALPFLQSDCRRGNCMTCTGRLIDGSNPTSLERGEDGLSPYVSEKVQNKGYILTCSSYVVGDGLKIELGKNFGAWQDMYQARFEDEDAKLAGREAMARVIRLSDEKNVTRWATHTENALENSG